MKFKNYRNKHTKQPIIYSKEDIGKMSVKDAFSRKQELLSQKHSIGVPNDSELSSSPNAVWVEDYVRDDGTRVSAHWRSKPEGQGSSTSNNIVLEGGIEKNVPAEEIPQDSQGSDNDVLNTVSDVLLSLLSSLDGSGDVQSIPNAQINIPKTMPNNSKSFKSRRLETVRAKQERGEDAEIANSLNKTFRRNTITGGAAQISSNELDYIVRDTLNEINNILENQKDLNIQNLENKIMSKNLFFEKPEYKSILYKSFIDINNSKNNMRPDARELMNISLVGIRNLPNSIEYNVLPYGSGKLFNETYKISKDSNKYIPDDYFGIEFSEYSSLSKNLSNSQELQRQVRAQYNPATGKFKTDKIDITLSSIDKNLQYSIGHFTIYNSKVSSDGIYTATGGDMYNYDWLKDDGSEAVNLNNKAYILQQLGIIKKYYIIVPIKFKFFEI